MYDGNQGEIDFGSNKLEVRVRDRGFEVSGVNYRTRLNKSCVKTFKNGLIFIVIL